MPPSPFIDIFNTVFPVLALKGDQGHEMTRPDSFGTAFSISPGVFLTAGHVVRNSIAVGRIAIGGSAGTERPFGVAEVSDYQVWDDLDVAVLFATPRVTMLNSLLANRLQVLSDVASFGYPHALTYLPDDHETPRIDVVFRAYKGYIITTRGFRELPNSAAIYEVSTPFPPGMSGGPLLYAHEDALIVAGIVLGCPEVQYLGMTQRVGAALITDEFAPLRIDRLERRIGDLPEIRPAQIRFDGRD